MTKIVKNKKQQQNIQPARRVCYAGTLNKLTILLLPIIAEDSITPPPIAERSIVMSVSVCLSVRDHISGTTRPIFTKCFVHAIYGSGTVLLWRRSDTLCTSGFMEEVIFAHKPRYLDVAVQLKHSAHAALGLAISCAQ